MSMIKGSGRDGRTGVKGKIIGRRIGRTYNNSTYKDYRLVHIGKADLAIKGI